jgi:hypothetical protein
MGVVMTNAVARPVTRICNSIAIVSVIIVFFSLFYPSAFSLIDARFVLGVGAFSVGFQVFDEFRRLGFTGIKLYSFSAASGLFVLGLIAAIYWVAR